MKKEIGLWIDHRKAVIVTIKDGDEEIKTINSNMEKHVRFTSEDGRGEDTRDRQFDNHLNSFYDEVIAYIRDATSVQIFGPGEAKGELEKRIEHEGIKTPVTIEAADKMTDGQVSAKVREHFLK
ncbi:MAG: hypothetical protein H7Y59_12110 [Anaerolineales bacterium]|nr:hypothetical protein [Anaerolineales bacterium]